MNERLRKLRKSLDMTQQNFGARISVKGNTVAQWESGRNEPSDSAISLICREFNVNEDWLRTGSGKPFIETPSSTIEQLKKEFRLDDFSYNLVYQYLKLAPEQRQIVRDFFYDVVESRSAEEDPAAGMPKTPEELEGKYPPVDIKAKTS